jgi:DNA-binding NtrC family response regulator
MLEGLNFLIVDDDPATIAALSQQLNRLKASKISVAKSGLEAYRMMSNARARFDYVISDVCMADGNGLELLYQIRTTTATQSYRPDMCVILMSGMASRDIAFAASRLDVNAFLVKPFGLTQLLSAITSARRRTFQLDRATYYKLTAAHLQVA